jgi:transposase
MQTPLHIGVDVAKDEVAAACAENTFAVRAIPNRRTALLAFPQSLPPGSSLGLEATGVYHERLADLAVTRGFTVFVLNPKDTRHYAQALGLRAKTDRVDAECIARFIQHESARLHAYAPPTTAQRRIDRLIQRRAKLTTVKGTLQLSFKGLRGFETDMAEMRQRLDAWIAKIDAMLAVLAHASPARRNTLKRLQTIVGVGPLVGISLANTLERVPFKNADAFVAFTGLDPRPRDSGQKIGRRRLSKRGPGELRRLLFNAAMSGARTRAWKPIYQHYRARGLPTTAALVVIARKIARTAWSVYHHQTTFDPKRVTQCLT